MSSLADIPAVLAAPFTAYLLQTHPNTFAHAPTPDIPQNLHYTSVLRAYLAENAAGDTSDLPSRIAHLIASVRSIQLPRKPIDISHVDTDEAQRRYPRLSQGMSPKKAHEVFRMAAYILAVVRANGLPTSAPDPGSQRLHIVDVGAGQGYLTRALRALLQHARILALDADHAQSAGAIKWEERLFGKDDEKDGKGKGKAGIEHRTVLIGAEGDPEELRLQKVVSEWVREGSDETEGDRGQAPVLFVALHACGSLTPALLRAFLAASTAQRDGDTIWRPAGAVAVGCCYNLMNPTDFPLSTALRTHEPALDLPPAAFHLAAQIPGTWLAQGTDQPRDCTDAEKDIEVAPVVALAIRKVAWRALLEHALKMSRPMTDEELRDAEDRAKLGAHQHTSMSSSFGGDAEKNTGDGRETKLKDSKNAKKQAKKEFIKKDVKEKKPSATVPARWQRRPENWVPNADVDLDEELSPSASPTTALKSTEKASAAEAQGQVGPQDHSAPSSGVGATPALRRLGRLRDSAYTADWESFLREAGARMGIVFEGRVEDRNEIEERKVLETQLETLHVLRCIVGPAIESAILRDRQEWLREALTSCPHQDRSTGEVGVHEEQETFKVELVNLFDQETGSGRNVAIVILPHIPCMSSSPS
ncbi:hypothetical protein D9619_007015 [Psilocybe cf. subviscida]|uniref:Methyltransferase domain-containing protein n=1 Tax=Psilocybe cf. subviscida TaxID=2480587 RepID=A0A8H5B1Q0_9AGAR|nr:hypothetical protein D9619_007015 [Psilocybe cf. subviscida]